MAPGSSVPSQSPTIGIASAAIAGAGTRLNASNNPSIGASIGINISINEQ
ncbi:MAG: hypothetical protein WA718_11190 [Terriglobales bacterium]